MKITTRDATEEDASFVAWVQLAAARGHVARGFWDLVLDGDEDTLVSEIAAVATAEARSFAHWSRFRIAEVDGIAAAGLSGYEPAEATDDLMIQAFMEAAERRKWSPALLADLSDRIAPFLTCVEPAPEDHWVVEWVATLPEYRGRGLVKRLLEEMLDRGRTRGFARAQISVLIGNTAAERAYQGVGFRKFDDRTHPAFESAIGEPGLRRMRMNLQESRK